jgi:hypothetical protein
MMLVTINEVSLQQLKTGRQVKETRRAFFGAYKIRTAHSTRKWKTLHSCTTYSADGGASALIMGATAASTTRTTDAVAPRVRCMGEFMAEWATDYPGVCSVIRMDR